MERSQNSGPVTNRTPSRGAASLLRNFEDVVMDRLIKYLNRKVRKSNRSHFCLFLLFLLVAGHGQSV